MQQQEIIEEIKKGNKKVLKEVYLDYENEFLNFLIKKYETNKEEALEVYQFTILRFYDNIIYGQLKTLTSTLKSYLFAIGKNIFKEHQRALQKEIKTSNQFILHQILMENNVQLEEKKLQEKESYYKKISAALNEIGNPCKQLLESFYYEKKSMQVIAQELNYKNTNVAKTKKLKCLKRLRRLIENNSSTL